jgi:hypothetical protein
VTATVAETARREAEEAERELEADEAAKAEGETPEPTPEPAPEPETPVEPEPVDLEKREKALSSEATRHENALKKAYGDDFEHRAFCPCCLGEGFLEPWAPGAMPDEVWEAVTALSGKMDTGELLTPDYIVRCENCGGYGEVATGAKGGAVRKVPCKRCDSRGWFDTEDPVHRGKLGLAPPQAPAPLVTYPTFHAPEAPAAVEAPLTAPSGWNENGRPGADSWGRWPGHPRHGIDPAMGGMW